jgi:hypothetical protein
MRRSTRHNRDQISNHDHDRQIIISQPKMLQTLLSPLRSRFDLSPKTPTTATVQSPKEQEQTQSPEDFARDVLVELMRSAVENLKRADGERAKCEVRWKLQRGDGHD